MQRGDFSALEHVIYTHYPDPFPHTEFTDLFYTPMSGKGGKFQSGVKVHFELNNINVAHHPLRLSILAFHKDKNTDPKQCDDLISKNIYKIDLDKRTAKWDFTLSRVPIQNTEENVTLRILNNNNNIVAEIHSLTFCAHSSKAKLDSHHTIQVDLASDTVNFLPRHDISPISEALKPIHESMNILGHFLSESQRMFHTIQEQIHNLESELAQGSNLPRKAPRIEVQYKQYHDHNIMVGCAPNYPDEKPYTIITHTEDPNSSTEDEGEDDIKGEIEEWETNNKNNKDTSEPPAEISSPLTITAKATSSMCGILFDVSGSMRSALQVNDVDSDHVQRVHALLSIAAKVVSEETHRHQVDDTLFIELFGLNTDEFSDKESETCDFITLLQNVPAPNEDHSDGHRKLIQLANIRGHRSSDVEPWIRKYLSSSEASTLHAFLEKHPDRINELVSLIPSASACVDKVGSFLLPGVGVKMGGYIPPNVSRGMNNFAANVVPSNVAEDSQAIKLARAFIDDWKKEVVSTMISATKPRLVTEISRLLKDVAANPNTEKQKKSIAALFQKMEPYIFGGTPMVASLRHARQIFETGTKHRRVLVIVSDGEAGDGDPVPITEQIKGQDVIVITCYLTDVPIANQKQLFHKEQDDWSKGEQVLFQMSSSMRNSAHPLSLLGRSQWRLASEGESCLFLRANNLDIVEEFFNTFLSCLSEGSADALLDVIGNVDLDIYINKLNEEATSPLQKGGTCYANAVGFVFYLSMKRIVGREVSSFDDLRKGLIRRYGEMGASTSSVLKSEAPKHRLHFNEVDEEGARQAINMRRPVVATFSLYDGNNSQWDNFTNFFKSTPKGVLQRSDIGNAATDDLIGHAVIMMRCDPTSLTFMNSWGDKWANGGFFSIKDASVLSNPTAKMRFYDVYWTEKDLLPKEIEAYKVATIERSKQLADKFPSVKDLMVTCPICNTPHPLDFYNGHCLRVECPSCENHFKPTGDALLKSLYETQHSR